MLFSNINLRDELYRERDQQSRLMDQVEEVLQAASESDKDISERLDGSSNLTHHQNLIHFEGENIFSLSQIRNVCIRYRLRFLDSSCFRSEFPYEAIIKIKELEKRSGIKIDSFKIMAPSKSFDLENINKDPLLFAKVSNQTFILIHKWGNDLAWFHRLAAWPFQSFKTLIISLTVLCFAFSFSLPASIMHILNFQSEVYLRIWLAIHTFIGMLGISLWLGISFDKSFSSMNWESKYYNY